MPGRDPRALPDYCRDKCGVVLGVGIGDLSGKAFRIAHMGHVNAPMVFGVLGAVEMALAALGIPHGTGGVQAAVDYLGARCRPSAKRASGARRGEPSAQRLAAAGPALARRAAASMRQRRLVVPRGLGVVRVRVEQHVARAERGERLEVGADLVEAALAGDPLSSGELPCR